MSELTDAKQYEEVQRLKKRVEELERQLEIDNKGNQEWIDSLSEQLCKMEDALGFKNDAYDKKGKWVPTIGPWLERVRDLIASEGELGDKTEQVKELENSLDLQIDEFMRIKALTENEEIRGLCDRAVKHITQHTPVIAQRDQAVQKCSELEASTAAMRELLTTIRQQVFPGLDLPVKYTVWMHECLSSDCGKELLAERDSLESQLAERIGVIDDFITACGFNVNDGFEINSEKIKSVKAERDHLRTLCREVLEWSKTAVMYKRESEYMKSHILPKLQAAVSGSQ